MITNTEHELVKDWENGEARVIDDLGDGHDVELMTVHEDSNSLSLVFHDGDREIQECIDKDDLKLDNGKTAKSFGADAILVTPGHISGDMHEDATSVYGN